MVRFRCHLPIAKYMHIVNARDMENSLNSRGKWLQQNSVYTPNRTYFGAFGSDQTFFCC